MSNVLLIRSSIFGQQSKSLRLANEFLSRYPHDSLVERLLTPSTMPHLTAETYLAMGKPDTELTREERGHVALSDALIAEVEAADTIVLAVPMYNLSIPSTLKAWIDHVLGGASPSSTRHPGRRACSAARRCSCSPRGAASTARVRLGRSTCRSPICAAFSDSWEFRTSPSSISKARISARKLRPRASVKLKTRSKTCSGRRWRPERAQTRIPPPRRCQLGHRSERKKK
jgi:hypothetical protein